MIKGFIIGQDAACLAALVLGDATKARTTLGWKPEVSFRDLVTMMVDADLARQRGETVTA